MDQPSSKNTVNNASSTHLAESGKISKVKKSNNTTSPLYREPPDILGGIMIVSVGILILLNNFGVVPWSFWSHILHFWPVIIVLTGLDILSGNKWQFRLLSTAIGIIILFFVFLYGLTASDFETRSFLFENFPMWKRIYSSIPNREVNVFDDFFNNDPDYRWDRRGNMRG